MNREQAAAIESAAWDDVDRVMELVDDYAAAGPVPFGGTLAIAMAVFRAHDSKDLDLPPWSRGLGRSY